MMGQVDGRWRIGRRQIVPSPLNSRYAAERDRAKRVVPRHAFINARVPGNENAKDEEQGSICRIADIPSAARNAPDETTGSSEEDRQTRAGDLN